MYDVDVGIPRAGHPLRAAAVCCYLNKKVAPLPLLAYKTAAAAACRCPGPVPRGHSGAVPPKSLFEPPPNENRASSSEDCAPWKLTGSVLLEYNSRPETPKILDVTPEIVSKNVFFVDFEINTVCFGDLTPEFIKTHVCLGTKTFICLFWSSLQKFVEIHKSFKMKSRIF